MKNSFMAYRLQGMSLDEAVWRLLEDANTRQEVEQHLHNLLSGPYRVWDEGGKSYLYEIRQLVDRIGKTKIEVYFNDHNPPHFHVNHPNVKASFRIEDCSVLAGEVDGSLRRLIEEWFKHGGKAKVEALWAKGNDIHG